MSHYYGTAQGSRGEVSRTGGKNSGITTHATCWSGAIRVRLCYDQETDEDRVVIELRTWPGRSFKATLLDASVQELVEASDSGDLWPAYVTLTER